MSSNTSLPDEIKPYIGPVPFERKDQALFFGRGHEVEELFSLLTAHPTVLLYSQSGAGKTSLLNAGLIPELEKAKFQVIGPARVRGELPAGLDYTQTNPYVYNALKSLSADKIKPSHLEHSTIKSYVHQLLPTNSDGELISPTVLIFDQFEELFTLNPELWAHRAGLFNQIAEVLNDSNLRVLFAMREDYIAEMDPFESLLPEKLRTRFRLERLREASALAAIKGPLTVDSGKGREFAPNVAEQLVQNLLELPAKNDAQGASLKGEFIEPVQLQVVCHAIWEKLGPTDKKITDDHLKQFGDVNKALTIFYEDSLKRAVAEANKQKRKGETELKEGTLRAWFDRVLITETGKRSMVLRGTSKTNGIPNAAIDELEARHIIRAELRDGERWYELSHDRFLQPIKESYKNWLLNLPGAERTRSRLEQKAAVWFEKGKDPELLLDGGEVLEARRHETAGEAYSDRVVALISSSEHAIQQKHAEEKAKFTRRLTWAFGAVVVLLLSTVVAAGYAISNAKRATRLAEEANQQSERAKREAENAKKSALIADEQRKEAETQKGLAQKNQKEAERQTEIANDALALAEVQAEAAKKASALALVEANRAKEAQRLEAGQRSLAESLGISAIASNGLNSVYFDPDVGALLGLEAANSAPTNQAMDVLRDSLVRLARSRAQLEMTPGENASITALVFNADGSRIVTCSPYTATVWDANGARITSLVPPQPSTSESSSARPEMSKAAFSPDRKYIVILSTPYRYKYFSVPSNDGPPPILQVWDAANFSFIKELKGGGAKRESLSSEVSKSAPGFDFVFNADGRQLFMVGESDIWGWDTITWERLSGYPIKLPELQVRELGGAALSPDGRFAITRTGLFDQQGLDVIDLATRKPVSHIDSPANPTTARFTPDGQFVATVEGNVKVWESATGKLVHETSNTNAVSVSFNHSGKSLLTLDSDSNAQLWSTFIGKDFVSLGRVDLSDPMPTFSTDDELLLLPQLAGEIAIVEASTGDVLAEFYGHAGSLKVATFNPDGSVIATSSSDAKVRLWNTFGEPGIIEFPEDHTVSSPGGKYFAAKRSIAVDDKNQRYVEELVVRAGKTGRKLWSHRCEGEPRREWFSPDEKFIVAYCDSLTGGFAGKEVYVFDAETGDVVTSLAEARGFDSVMFSPNGMNLLTTSGGDAQLWDAKNGKLIKEFKGGMTDLSVAFSRDGRLIVGATGDEIVHVWNVMTGTDTPSPDIHDTPQHSAVISPNGKFVVSVADDSFYLWKVGEKTSSKLEIPGVDSKKRLEFALDQRSFSPDGKFLVIPITAQVWDLETGREIARLSASEGSEAVTVAEFSPDGQYVLTALTTGTIKIWSPQTWRMIAVLREGRTSIDRAIFGGVGGKSVITSGYRGTRVHPPESYGSLEELRTIAQRRITRQKRELTPAECQQYLGDAGFNSRCPKK
ncbi:MAG TPA: PQQ-binding-like beta-propeller repeat protein [Pyrinomonadaceae bacterium]|nr:PQQ-binding-like beta-propeller repeat protein [Pyrinomonadaceae bacterium]